MKTDRKELEQLRIKIRELRQFIECDKFQRLSEFEQTALKGELQARLMLVESIEARA